jgi:hypothetical protein
MIDPLSAAILDIATDPAVTPFRATMILRGAGAPADWGVRELCDRRLWVSRSSRATGFCRSAYPK